MLQVISQNGEIEWELKTERLILLITAGLKKNFGDREENNAKNRNNLGTEFNIRELKIDDADFIFTHSHI